MKVAYLEKYSPDQPRDEGGRWTDGGTGSAVPSSERNATVPLFHSGLRGDERRMVVQQVALAELARLGMSDADLRVVDRHDTKFGMEVVELADLITNVKVAGEYNSDTKQITIHSDTNFFSQNELLSIVQHEASHVRFDVADHGSEELRRWIRNSENVKALEHEGRAISDYARSYWDRAKHAQGVMSIDLARKDAINESLAEYNSVRTSTSWNQPHYDALNKLVDEAWANRKKKSIEVKYSPDQPRDDYGRWMFGGGPDGKIEHDPDFHFTGSGGEDDPVVIAAANAAGISVQTQRAIDAWVEDSAGSQALEDYVDSAPKMNADTTVYRAEFGSKLQQLRERKVGEEWTSNGWTSTARTAEALEEGVVQPLREQKEDHAIVQIKLHAGEAYGRLLQHSYRNHPENAQREFLMRKGITFKMLHAGPNWVLDAHVANNTKGFDPDQPRDENGQWTSGGGAGGAANGDESSDSNTFTHTGGARATEGVRGTLEMLASAERGARERGFESRAQLLLDVGKEVVAVAGTPRGPEHMCYNTAAEHMVADRSDYVEGYIFVHGVPLAHAWNREEGKDIDYTVKDSAKWPHYGVVVPEEVVFKVVTSRRFGSGVADGVLGTINLFPERQRKAMFNAIRAANSRKGVVWLEQKYSEDQPRDDSGRWTDGAGGGMSASVAPEESAFKTDNEGVSRVEREFNKLSDFIMEAGTGKETSDYASMAKLEVAYNLSQGLAENADWKNFLGAQATVAGEKPDPQQVTSDLVRSWARTSSDDDAKSLLLQSLAAEEFGMELSSLSDKFQKDYNTVADDLRAMKLAAQYGIDGHPNATAIIKDGYRAFLREMYTQTQADLAKRGITEVYVARGYRGSVPELDVYSVRTNPMSSFSASFYDAHSFASYEGSVMITKVPAERVLSTPRTGFGCRNETEVVVLGGKYQAAVVPRTYIDDEEEHWHTLFRWATMTTKKASKADLQPDDDLLDADWLKTAWDLPPYKSPEFNALVPDLEHFKTLPVYEHAVANGLIVNDEWAGTPQQKAIVAKYSEDQPRDENGRWTSEGSSSDAAGRKRPPHTRRPVERPTFDTQPGFHADWLGLDDFRDSVRLELEREKDIVGLTIEHAAGPPTIEVRVTDEPRNFQVGGMVFSEGGWMHDNHDGTYVLGFRMPGTHLDGLPGLVAHEAEHIRFDFLYDRYNAEENALRNDPAKPYDDAGMVKPGYEGKYPTVAALRPLFGPNAWPELQKSDGVTEYSRAHWRNWKEGRGSTRKVISETLAEISSMRAKGKAVGVAPQWARLHAVVGKLWHDYYLDQTTPGGYNPNKKKAVVYLAKYSEDQPRDEGGRWTDGGGGVVPATERDANGEITAHAGLNESEWMDWAYDSDNIIAAQRGELKTGDLSGVGEKLTQEDVERFKSIGERIQHAAENTLLEAGILYRGTSFATEDDFKAAFKFRKEIVADRLTSATTLEHVARDYATTEKGDTQPVHVLVRYQSADGKMFGVQTAQLGVLSAEVVMPKGATFRVAAIRREGDFRIVDLYSSVKHKGASTPVWRPPEQKRFNPDQPRDEHGRWTSDGGTSTSHEQEKPTAGATTGKWSPLSASTLNFQGKFDGVVKPLSEFSRTVKENLRDALAKLREKIHDDYYVRRRINSEQHSAAANALAFAGYALDAHSPEVGFVALSKEGDLRGAAIMAHAGQKTAKLEFLGSLQRGAGSALLRQVEVHARSKGSTRLGLESTNYARPFYRAQGFKESNDYDYDFIKDLSQKQATPEHDEEDPLGVLAASVSFLNRYEPLPAPGAERVRLINDIVSRQLRALDMADQRLQVIDGTKPGFFNTEYFAEFDPSEQMITVFARAPGMNSIEGLQEVVRHEALHARFDYARRNADVALTSFIDTNLTALRTENGNTMYSRACWRMADENPDWQQWAVNESLAEMDRVGVWTPTYRKLEVLIDRMWKARRDPTIVIEKYAPDQPRDDQGRWTDAGGGSGSDHAPVSGIEMVSPNVEENLTFDQAVRALDSARQHEVLAKSDEIDRILGTDVRHLPAVGAWADGAENSILGIVNRNASYEEIELAAAMKGMIADQKAVIPFHVEESGPDAMYNFRVPSGNLRTVHEDLGKLGIEYHTLRASSRGGVQVWVFDKGSELASVLQKAGEKYGTSVEVWQGRGNFLGGETRDQGRAAYAKVIEERLRGSDKAGRWERLYGDWRQAHPVLHAFEDLIRKYSEDQPRDERGRWTDGGGVDAYLSGGRELEGPPGEREVFSAQMREQSDRLQALGYMPLDREMLLVNMGPLGAKAIPPSDYIKNLMAASIETQRLIDEAGLKLPADKIAIVPFHPLSKDAPGETQSFSQGHAMIRLADDKEFANVYAASKWGEVPVTFVAGDGTENQSTVRCWTIAQLDKPGSADEMRQRVFQHELGHALAHATDTEKWFRRNFFTQDGTPKVPVETLKAKWTATHISKYAASSMYEAMAESFAMVTSRGYVKGTLPKHFEKMVDHMLGKGRRAALKKAAWIPNDPGTPVIDGPLWDPNAEEQDEWLEDEELRTKASAEWDEEKHPRAPGGTSEGGRFTSGAGGEGTPTEKEPTGTGPAAAPAERGQYAKFDKNKWSAAIKEDMGKAREAFAALSEQERDAYADATRSVEARIEDLIGGDRQWGNTGDMHSDIETRIGQFRDRELTTETADRLQEFAISTHDKLIEAGAEPDAARALTMKVTDYLVAQDFESAGRSLGDHGVYHILQDANLANQTLAAAGIGNPRTEALINIAAAFHDAGYLTEPSRAFLDTPHERWSAQNYEANLSPTVEAAFGREFANEVASLIYSHADTELDWTNEPIKSAFSTADNLALFHSEKMPPFMRDVPANTGVLVALARGKLDVAAAQEALRSNIDKSQLNATLKKQLREATYEVTGVLPKFTLGMIGTKLDSVRWKGDHPEYVMYRSKANEALSKVLDVGHRQFTKFASTYNTSSDDFIKTGHMSLAKGDKVLLEATIRGWKKVLDFIHGKVVQLNPRYQHLGSVYLGDE